MMAEFLSGLDIEAHSQISCLSSFAHDCAGLQHAKQCVVDCFHVFFFFFSLDGSLNCPGILHL